MRSESLFYFKNKPAFNSSCSRTVPGTRRTEISVLGLHKAGCDSMPGQLFIVQPLMQQPNPTLPAVPIRTVRLVVEHVPSGVAFTMYD